MLKLENYKTREEFFSKTPLGLNGFKERLTRGKKSAMKNPDELILLFQETDLVNSEEDAKELLFRLDADFRLNYGEEFLAIRKLKKKDYYVYHIDTCKGEDFY